MIGGEGEIWLLAGREKRSKVFTLRYFEGTELLPLFGSAEEARDFLFFYGAFGGGLRVEKVGTEELISLLEGAYSHVEKVVLDPLAGMDAEEVIELVSMDRESFVELLPGERRPAVIPMGREAMSAGEQSPAVRGCSGLPASLVRLFSERPQTRDFDVRELSLLLWLRGYLPYPPPEELVAEILREERDSSSRRFGGAA